MKKYVALARVSSREQEREGFSLDVQEDALKAYADRNECTIIKLFRIAETASGDICKLDTNGHRLFCGIVRLGYVGQPGSGHLDLGEGFHKFDDVLDYSNGTDAQLLDWGTAHIELADGAVVNGTNITCTNVGAHVT